MLPLFDANSPLLRHGVLRWCGDAHGSDLAQPLRVSREWLDALTGRSAFRAKPEVDVISACERAAIDPDLAMRIQPLLHAARAGQPIRLILQGPHGVGKHTLARGIAQALQVPLVRVDLRDCTSTVDLQSTLQRAMNTALARCALPYLHGAGRLQARDPQLVRTLQSLLADQSISFVLALTASLPFAHGAAVAAERLELDLPSPTTRRRVWNAALQRHAVTVATAEIEAVAARFVLSGAQIEQAASDVAHRLNRDGTTSASSADLAAAARALCGNELAQMAQRVRAVAGFDSLVAATEVEAQLREICARVRLRDQVRRHWIGNSVHGRNVGVNALFAGPPGTGKTMAAEIVACELGLDLFRSICRRWSASTSARPKRTWTAFSTRQTNANAILFFDEADALFGKRSRSEGRPRSLRQHRDRLSAAEDGSSTTAWRSWPPTCKRTCDEAFSRR